MKTAKELLEESTMNFIELTSGAGYPVFYNAARIALVRPSFTLGWLWSEARVDGSWICTDSGDRFVQELPEEVMAKITAAQ